jgi:hypothetical protein
MYEYTMGDKICEQMARTRALMTETERRYISEEVDIEENKRYQAIARVRDRLDSLEEDINVLEEHHPELLSEVQKIVCRD